MKNDEENTEMYITQKEAIRQALKNTTQEVQLHDECEIMHAVCEVVSEITRDAGMGFEDYFRCVLCAWDCSLRRGAHVFAAKDHGCN